MRGKKSDSQAQRPALVPRSVLPDLRDSSNQSCSVENPFIGKIGSDAKRLGCAERLMQDFVWRHGVLCRPELKESLPCNRVDRVTLLRSKLACINDDDTG